MIVKLTSIKYSKQCDIPVPYDDMTVSNFNFPHNTGSHSNRDSCLLILSNALTSTFSSLPVIRVYDSTSTQ